MTLDHLNIIVSSRSFARISTRLASSETAFDRKSIQYAGKQIKQTLKGRDVVFYQAPEGVKRMFMFMYISAGVQLMFW